MDKEEKQTKLNEMLKVTREELSFRRTREQQIFTWSSAILVAIAAATLLSKVDETSLISSAVGKLIAISSVLIICFLSALWQMKQRKLLSDVQKVSADIMDALEYFEIFNENNVPVLPDTWKKWGSVCVTWRSQLTRPSKIVTTLILGFGASIALYFQ